MDLGDVGCVRYHLARAGWGFDQGECLHQCANGPVPIHIEMCRQWLKTPPPPRASETHMKQNSPSGKGGEVVPVV
jgi:hypothetical protein